MEILKKILKMIKIKSFLRKIADVLNEHWIWKVIILFIPSVYMPIIIKYAGEALSLADADGQLSPLGWKITVIVYASVLGINILSSYKAKRDKEDDLQRNREFEVVKAQHEEEIEIYKTNLGICKTVLQVIGNVCDSKLDSIMNYIDNSISKGQFAKPFNETVYPDRQLKSIAKEIKRCISKVTEIPFDNITVSMAQEFPEISKSIKWVDQIETMQCMKLDKLKKNVNTTFYKVYSRECEYLFYNDKIKASQEGNYAFDNKDHRYNDIGSVLCEEICIEDNNVVIARIILSISTYGYKFTESEDDEVIKRISDMVKDVILQQFDKRIKIELSLLYVKKKYNAQ